MTYIIISGNVFYIHHLYLKYRGNKNIYIYPISFHQTIIVLVAIGPNGLKLQNFHRQTLLTCIINMFKVLTDGTSYYMSNIYYKICIHTHK